jgi:hypothetical protein
MSEYFYLAALSILCRAKGKPALAEDVYVTPCRAAAPTALRRKIAEVEVGERNLRIFETGNEDVLAVLEKSKAGRSQYAIERDDGLIADLTLFAEASEHRRQ